MNQNFTEGINSFENHEKSQIESVKSICYLFIWGFFKIVFQYHKGKLQENVVNNNRI